MSTAAELTEAAIAGLDDSLQPTDKPVDDTTPTAPEPAEPVDTPAEGKDPKEGETEDDNGFTADEVTDEPQPETKPAPDIAPLDTSGLEPEAKYIYDNLPQIATRIKDGDSLKTVQVKSWAQLPEDVEFATKRDELAFINAITAQEYRARDLQQQFQRSQQEVSAKDFSKKEDTAVMADIADLQKQGLMAKFKGSRDDPEFKDDAAAQQVEDVLDYMRKQNAQYLADYQNGKPMRYIGFREAFILHQHGKGTQTPAEVEEDTERQQLARKTQVNRGLATSELKKPAYKSGQIRTREQLLASIEELI